MRLLVVDAKNLLFRLCNRVYDDGGIVLPFVNSLNAIKKKFNTSEIVLAWDGGVSEWRRKLLPSYKSGRRSENKAIDDILEQGRVIRKVLGNAGIPSLHREGIEADDWIFAVLSVCLEAGCNVIIFSNDQDFYQLLDHSVIWNGKEVKTDKEFVSEFSFSPSVFPQYRAIVGDASDNIFGVPRIGKLGAKNILSEYGDFYNFLESGRGSKYYDSVVNHKDRVEMNISLIDLSKFPEKDVLHDHVVDLLAGPSDFDFKSVVNDINNLSCRTITLHRILNSIQEIRV